MTTFMATYGDGVADIDIRALLEFHDTHGKLATVTTVRPPARFGQMIIDGQRVQEFSEKPQTGEGWINGGFFVLNRKVLDYIDGDATLWEREPMERLARDGELMAYRHEGFWQPMDTLAREAIARRSLEFGPGSVEDVVVSSRPLTGVLLAALFLTSGCRSKQGPPVDDSGGSGPHFVRQIPWVDKGQWIRIDTHIHTTFSDGASTPAEVVQKALQYGCRAIAITDRADRGLKAATPEYEAAITAERSAHPDLLILAGLEWNVPPWAGDEHASVLMPGGPGEWKTLADFKQQFDDYQREGRDHAIVEAALKWLAENGTVSGVPPVVVYNHPSLKDSTSMDNVRRCRALARGE